MFPLSPFVLLSIVLHISPLGALPAFPDRELSDPTDPGSSSSSLDLNTPPQEPQPKRPKAVHFGPGNIGRGFIGEKLSQAGWDVVFVGRNKEAMKELQDKGSYNVTEFGPDGEQVIVVDDYRAIYADQTNPTDAANEIADADLITCAVGANNLKSIAPIIRAGLLQRSKQKLPAVPVIACENKINATDELSVHINSEVPHEAILLNQAIFLNSAIDRIVPNPDADAGLNIKTETFSEWVVDASRLGNDVRPDVPAIKWVDNLLPYIERKLYTVNTGHASIAFAGYAAGMTLIDEAIGDDTIHRLIKSALNETSSLITEKYPTISVEEQAEYVETVIQRFKNKNLPDTVVRVGASPLRKLGRMDRLVNPAVQLAEMGTKPSSLLTLMESALQFTDVRYRDGETMKEDAESFRLGTMLGDEKQTAEMLAGSICGLYEEDQLFKPVVQLMKAAKTTYMEKAKRGSALMK